LSQEKNKISALAIRAISQPGCYLLLLRVKKNLILQVGKLGRFYLKAGNYAYSGSARKGLGVRIGRYLSREKNCFWHIDYLLAQPEVKIKKILLFPGSLFPQADEHSLVKEILARGGEVVIPGFGSSDCREKCPAHLVKISPSFMRTAPFNQAIELTPQELKALLRSSTWEKEKMMI